MNRSKEYEKLHKLGKEIRILGGVYQLLEWDQETYMPTGASGIRGEQLSVIAGLVHTKKTAKPFKAALEKLINIKTGKITAKNISDEQKASILKMHRDYTKDIALPVSFVEMFASLVSEAMTVWREAKTKQQFGLFLPYLKKIIEMNRKKADLLGFKTHPYDALLDIYEPGITTSKITEIFKGLNVDIRKLLKYIQSVPQVDDSFLYGNFPAKKQLEISQLILRTMGYNFKHGRLDLSVHPFSSSFHPTDSRITTHIHTTALMSCISAALHEGGHSLYEMRLPVEHFGTPLCEPISLGVHESQSRWWETRIGQSKPFWEYFYPILKKKFKGKFDSIPLESFYKGINKTQPSLIRIEADEVTYNLHIILRFELEKALIEGSLKVEELPDAWNQKMQQYFGIMPTNDAEGCLQDIHWSLGSFGYFPTYALGNLYASHLFSAFEKTYPVWKEKVANGELLFIKEWLNETVHKHGRRYDGLELLEMATGKPFSEKAFIDYLNDKYKEIYRAK